ncbi:MAG TPA: hypothetical protein DD706_01195 [Nitrospiraceae bacterium]|nr:hypothetical protein [Nitrospiraceae bacterium]
MEFFSQTILITPVLLLLYNPRTLGILNRNSSPRVWFRGNEAWEVLGLFQQMNSRRRGVEEIPMDPQAAPRMCDAACILILKL